MSTLGDLKWDLSLSCSLWILLFGDRVGNRKGVYGIYPMGLSVKKKKEEKTSQCFLISRPNNNKKALLFLLLILPTVLEVPSSESAQVN